MARTATPAEKNFKAAQRWVQQLVPGRYFLEQAIVTLIIVLHRYQLTALACQTETSQINPRSASGVVFTFSEPTVGYPNDIFPNVGASECQAEDPDITGKSVARRQVACFATTLGCLGSCQQWKYIATRSPDLVLIFSMVFDICDMRW